LLIKTDGIIIPAPVPSSLRVSPEMSELSGSIIIAMAPPACAIFRTWVTTEQFFVLITKMKLAYSTKFYNDEVLHPKGSVVLCLIKPSIDWPYGIKPKLLYAT